MKPNDHFSFVKNNLVSQDSRNLLRLYLPILGQEATNLYQYFLAFWDNGADTYTLGQILNHLNVGMEVLRSSLDILSAMHLIDFYKQERGYQVFLKAPLSAHDFLSNPVYRRLLEKKIGEAAVESLLPEQVTGDKQGKKLSQIFQLEEGQLPIHQAPKQTGFELDYFKQLMARDQLRFADEKEDLLALFTIAEQKNWTWYETYLLAKETAVSKVISTKRMKQKLAQQSLPDGEFSAKERVIIREAKNASVLDFLAKLKSTRNAFITANEREFLKGLAQEGFLDEVINVIVFLTFTRIDSGNLNEKYASKVANDFAHRGVHTAEEAVLRIREMQKNQAAHTGKRTKESKPNIPEWSNPDYKNETSPERQAELEEQKRKLLAKLDQGGD